MSIITFWNNSKGGHIGQTSSLIATATSMAIEHNYKILLISTQEADKELDKAYGIAGNATMKFLGIKESNFNSGIEGIMKLASSGRLSEEMICNYTKIVLKGNRLEVLSGKDETKEDEIDNFIFEKYVDILKIANKFYDMVFVDLNRNLNSNLTRDILDLSNIVVFNFEQKFSDVEMVERTIEEEKKLLEHKTLYLFNHYEKNSKYNAKDIVRASKIRKKLYQIPYDLMFSDMIQDGAVDQWFLNPKIRRATLVEEHGYFIEEVNRFCAGIIQKLDELHMMGY